MTGPDAGASGRHDPLHRDSRLSRVTRSKGAGPGAVSQPVRRLRGCGRGRRCRTSRPGGWHCAAKDSAGPARRRPGAAPRPGRGDVDRPGAARRHQRRRAHAVPGAVQPAGCLRPWTCSTRMSGPDGELFEYWGRMASLLPVAHQPLFRWRMEQARPLRREPDQHRAGATASRAEHADYIDPILQRGDATAARSPPRQLDRPPPARRRVVGPPQRRAPGARGTCSPTVRSRRGATPLRARLRPAGARHPTAVLAVPTPPVEEAHRRLLVLAAVVARCRHRRDLAGYYLLPTRTAKARVAELVEAGELVQVTVEGWREPAYVVPDARPVRPARAHATLLSPFDSLIWERRRTSRLFEFDYRIEVYVPAPQRTYGYFVLPLLLGDEVVAPLRPQGRSQGVGAARARGLTSSPVPTIARSRPRPLAELDSLRGGSVSIASRSRGAATSRPRCAGRSHRRAELGR